LAVLLAGSALAGRWWAAAEATRARSVPAARPAHPLPDSARSVGTGRPAARAGRPVRAGGGDLVTVLRRLDAARDAAFAAGVPSSLADVYVRGSPPLRLDEGRLRGLARAGRRTVGLALRVTSAVVVYRSPAVTTLDVVDALPPYRVVDRAGTVVARSPGRGPAAWRIVLRRTGQGWRIAAVTAGPPVSGASR
ncbi:MAG: hypothetical protein ACJ74O_00085, partial [Frankiaceae bacterium]